MEIDDKLILIGLPSTGKTTFLAAFWYLVDSSPIQTSLKLEELHGEREYLNLIRNKWINCEKLERTRLIDEQFSSMILKGANNEQLVELQITDLSGETYQKQWSERIWTNKFIDQITDAKGALLFIHPDEVIGPTRIDQASDLAGEIIKENEVNPQENDVEPKEWEPRLSPMQVQLVELLQFIELKTTPNFSFRLAVVISAWEKVMSLFESPDDWLSQMMPFLNQYLISNQDFFPHRIYGVSAQGGDYKDATKLRRYNLPAERIIIVGDECSDHDLTIPVSWLMKYND